jgi:hypothetical protein
MIVVVAPMIFACYSSVEAQTSVRKLGFIVEQPYEDFSSIPDNDQRRNALELQGQLYTRILNMEIEGYKILDGREAIAEHTIDRLIKSDALVQFLITSSQYFGQTLVARMYVDKLQKWVALGIITDKDPSSFLKKIDAELLPNIVVRALELVQPSDRSVVLVDCIIPNRIPNVQIDATLIQAGLLLSAAYGKALQQDRTLTKKHSVARLVPTSLGQFYDWWCEQLRVPRTGFFRADTLTVFGVLQKLSSTDYELTLESVPNGGFVQGIPIDPTKPVHSLKRITQTVEGMFK